jgi:anaerobic selenocysteine-containing dehydrogenase
MPDGTQNPVEKPSVCTLDCPDTCSLSVSVADDRIVKVRGSRANPVTEGAICAKVTDLTPEFVHGPDRIRTPLRRTGARGSGEFEPIGWDEALDLAATGLRKVVERYGPQAVAPFNYAGPHGMLAQDSMSLRFFHKLGASRLIRDSLCGGVRGRAGASVLGRVPGATVDQASQSDLIVVWGNNATCSNLHLVRHIIAAKRRGARLVTVDPRRVKVAAKADIHLPVRPGADVVLAFALGAEIERLGGLDEDFIGANVVGAERWLERARNWTPEKAEEASGVPAASIREVARLYVAAERPLIAVGNGLERNANGGSGIRAICALPALTGKFGRAGSGLILSASANFPRTPVRLQRADFIPDGTRILDIVDLPKHILDDNLDPPVRAVVIYSHNPVIVLPEQARTIRALSHPDLFSIGIEAAMTDSMKYCDVVLPACTSFEHSDLYGAYGQNYLQRADAVIPPVGEAKPLTEIFRLLAQRYGFDDPAFRATDEELMDDALDAADPRMQGRRPSEIRAGEAVAMLPPDRETPVLYRNVFPATPSGKVELFSETLEQESGQGLPDYKPVADGYPLMLISPASDKRVTSTFGGCAANDGTPLLEMHPEDAMARGLDDGSPVRVFNGMGEVNLVLRLTEGIARGVVSSDKGAWMKTSDNGQTISALAPATLGDLAGACFNDARVEVAGT